jgi:hypothetical protein
MKHKPIKPWIPLTECIRVLHTGFTINSYPFHKQLHVLTFLMEMQYVSCEEEISFNFRLQMPPNNPLYVKYYFGGTYEHT